MPGLISVARSVRRVAGLAVCGAFLVALAGCAPKPDGGAFRAEGAPIYSNASFDLARLLGSWTQVAGFADGPGCTGGTSTFSQDASGQLQGVARICIAGRMQDWSGPVLRQGPGRFVIGDGEVWWVLWDDADNRTLVIGTPTGSFGFVLDRSGALPSDRQAAAREILDFNGYNLDRLQVY